MEKTIKCGDCGKEVVIETNARYRRKYCKECSEQRKKDYENIHEITADQCEEC